MTKLIRIQTVKPLEDFHVQLQFTDGTVKRIDLRPYLVGPVFERIIKDRSLFESVAVDSRSGTIAWPGGVDLDPDALYHGLTPVSIGLPSSVSP